MIRRLVLGVLVIVAVLCVVAAATVYWFLSGDGVRRALESQASSWLREPVHIASAHAALWPRVGITMAEVSIGEPARVILGAVDLSAPLRPLLSRRIEDADITISRSRLDMPLPFSMPSLERPTAPAAPGGAMRLVSIRSIALRDVVLASRGRTITVSADSALAGSELGLQRFTAASGSTELEAAGIVALDPRVDARLRVKANKLDMDELLALANAFAPAGPGSPDGRLPIRIAARVSSETATVDGVQAREFATDLEIDGDNVALSPLSCELFGGRYEGSLSATLGRTLSASLRARLQDLDVAQLAAFGGVADAITGRLTGAGTFTGAGPDFAGVLRSARGSGTASIMNGTIAHLDLVRTVVLFFGTADSTAAPGSGDHFDRIDARFSLAQQRVRADALALHSADADIVGQGTLDLASKALDGAFDLSLSESLSKQAGSDLFRYAHEGNRIVLPAKLGGTLGGPRLTVDAAAAVQRGLKNEIQRRLGNILDLFQRQP